MECVCDSTFMIMSVIGVCVWYVGGVCVRMYCHSCSCVASGVSVARCSGCVASRFAISRTAWLSVWMYMLVWGIPCSWFFLNVSVTACSSPCVLDPCICDHVYSAGVLLPFGSVAAGVRCYV